MTKQITLYLDLDGVVCDFQSAYEDRFDVQLNKVTEDIWETNWKTWVDEKIFERLKWYKGGRELIAWHTPGHTADDSGAKTPARPLSAAGEADIADGAAP